VEFFKFLGWNQNINHLHPHRALTTDVIGVETLDLIGSPFDAQARTVDVRRINSHRTLGRYNIPSVGLFIWRLKSYSVTRSRPHCEENVHPNCFTFSLLGQDTPLFRQPEAEMDETTIAGEANVAAPIRRLAFEKNPALFYGEGKSFAIWVDGWAGFDPAQPIPIEAIVPADLSDWAYAPLAKHIAVDPVLGRFAFPLDQDQMPRKGVRVSYHYGFSADVGGGEYARPILNPSPRPLPPSNSQTSPSSNQDVAAVKTYQVGEGKSFSRVGEAINQWQDDKPQDAVIEITDSGVYVEPINIRLNANQTLQLRAASGVRPILRMLDWQTDLPDALTVAMCRDTRFTLDGLLVTGRGAEFHGPERDKPADPRDPICGAEILIRHCTFVPGWELECDCTPVREGEPSLEFYNIRAKVRIQHSILGAIQVHEDEVKSEPIPICITDSVLDATGADKEAIGAPGYAVAHAILTMLRCTVFGIVDVHAVVLAENCIFNHCLNVARRQLGCMRFCHVPYGCRTPRRYHCQPDLAAQTIVDTLQAAAIANNQPAPTTAELDAAQTRERLRVRPQFNSERYGTPAYCQLADDCADEIKRGADDESEMGVFHDLFQPQRMANLLARLEEFTPAGTEVGIIQAT
jgi:hypothetical protein